MEPRMCITRLSAHVGSNCLRWEGYYGTLDVHHLGVQIGWERFELVDSTQFHTVPVEKQSPRLSTFMQEFK